MRICFATTRFFPKSTASRPCSPHAGRAPRRGHEVVPRAVLTRRRAATSPGASSRGRPRSRLPAGAALLALGPGLARVFDEFEPDVVHRDRGSARAVRPAVTPGCEADRSSLPFIPISPGTRPTTSAASPSVRRAPGCGGSTLPRPSPRRRARRPATSWWRWGCLMRWSGAEAWIPPCSARTDGRRPGRRGGSWQGVGAARRPPGGGEGRGDPHRGLPDGPRAPWRSGGVHRRGRRTGGGAGPRRLPFARHLGFLDRKALPDLYADADIFVFPSPTETCGLVALEALASGVPVIGADAGGVPGRHP